MGFDAPPLTGLRVLEFAGLAPGPFAGMLLADYGASVLRLDRPDPQPIPDLLTRRKTSICVDLKSPRGIALIKKLVPRVDVVIDPFRPGVLEKLGLDPETVLLKLNPRLVVGRLTGYRRDGKYSAMAGHDINYIAVSGVLSLLGRQGEKPYPPANILGDFAGGGAMCVLGILLALFAREKSGRGQIVEANMVDGSAILATMPRLGLKTSFWNRERGMNVLDGGAPFYQTYKTKDGKYMAVGAIEPQFFAALLKGLGLTLNDLPGNRDDPAHWPKLMTFFAEIFQKKTRGEWESIFDGSDACCTPVLTNAELEAQGFDQRPAVTLKATPGMAINQTNAGQSAAQGQGTGWQGDGWSERRLRPGSGGEATLRDWAGWSKGNQYDEEDRGLVLKDSAKL